MPAVNVETRLELPANRWLLAVRGDTRSAGGAVLGMVGGGGRFGPGAVVYPAHAAYPAAMAAVRPGLGPGHARQWPPGRGLALGTRLASPLGHPPRAVLFNVVQILLVLLALAGLAALYDTLQSGLLGLPRVQVGGGGSTATALVWTYDRVAGAVPVASAVSAPLVVFRLLLLLWAVWLARTLITLVRWGFDCLIEGGGWRSFTIRLTLPGRRMRPVRRNRSPRGRRRPEPDRINTKPAVPRQGHGTAGFAIPVFFC